MEKQYLAFLGSELLVREGAEGPALDGASLEGLARTARRDFDWEGLTWSALALDPAAGEEARARGLGTLPVRQALALWPEAALRPLFKGLALLNWLEGARHCGACGTLLVDAAARDPEGEVAAAGGRTCPSCGRPHFPRISPAVIVLVRKEGKALLARNARMPPGGRFGLLAGFVEVGETLEEAAVREVREEAAIEIGNLRYRKSQPWPFPDSLMLAYTADWVSGEARPDGAEIAELRWCGPEELPEIPPPGSVARALIDAFAAGGD